MYEVVEHTCRPLSPTSHGIYATALEATEVHRELEEQEFRRVGEYGQGSVFRVVDLQDEPRSDFAHCRCHVYEEVNTWPVGWCS